MSADRLSVEESKTKASQSLTVKASLGQAFVPLIAFFVAKHSGLDNEASALIAGSIFAALASLANIGMRRAIGFGVLLILPLLPLTGCDPTSTRVGRAYVKADEKTYDAVSMRWRKLEKEHGSEFEQELCDELLSSWRARIDEEKKAWK